MNLRELVAATGIAERQVRYLISEGFMPPPTGGRAHAQYDTGHIEAINRYARLRDIGFPPAAIRRLLQARAGVPFPIAPGITLVVDPDLIGGSTNAEAVGADILRTLQTLFPGDR